MTNMILIESDGSYKGGYVSGSDKTFEELKNLKEKDGRVAYQISNEQLQLIKDGYGLEIINGEVSLFEII